jgi:1-acyl-sn-glycerol-3-phosphate acyltransferase
MVDVLRSIWIWAASAALVVLWVPLLGLVRLFDREPLHRRSGRFLRRLGRVLAKVNPWRLHFSGLEHLDPKEVYVIVSNHQSLADIPLISHLRVDAKWLAKAELFRLPVVGWLLQMAGDVGVERTDRRKAAQALLRCSKYLRQGCSLVFFPEGTRSRDGEMLPFNDGPFQLAIREQRPVLPLVVEGSGAALPRSSWIFGPKQDILLRVMEPVRVDGWNAKQAAELKDSVRESMISELHRMRGAAQDLPVTAA